jgi:hypothetical protein
MSADADGEPDYSLLAVSDPSADATSTQTWAVIDDDHPSASWPAAPAARGARTSPPERGGVWDQRPQDDWDAAAGGPHYGGARPVIGQNGHLAPGENALGVPPMAGFGDPRTASTGAYGALDIRREAAGGPRTSGQLATRTPGDLAPAVRTRKGGSRPSKAGRRAVRPSKKHNAMIIGMMLVPVLIVAMVVAGYVYFHIKRSSSVVRAAPSITASSPSSSPAPAGPWKYIQSRSADPVPLTLRELFPHRFTAGTVSGLKTVSRAGTKCTREVIGKALTAAVGKARCTQVLRASYVSSTRKMMATIGVLNLATVRAAERVGRAAGSREFIRQLPAAHGPTHNLTKGTGVEEAEVKGHYLILIWTEFTNLRAPSGAKQRARLVGFSNALIRGTVNQSLTSRMVTGHPQTR